MSFRHLSAVRILKGRPGLCFRKCLFSVTRTSAPTHSAYAATGKPLTGVMVTVDGASDTTGSNGFYSIPNVTCGTHQISVNVSSGYSGYNYIVNLSGPAWDIYLTKPGTVYGHYSSSGYSADPVNTTTGNYAYQRKDVKIPGKA